MKFGHAMADYYSVLQRAVAMLPDNTGQARRAIYEKARTALVRQLESVNPPLPASEITKQRLALEEAVRRIEQELAQHGQAALAGATARTVNPNFPSHTQRRITQQRPAAAAPAAAPRRAPEAPRPAAAEGSPAAPVAPPVAARVAPPRAEPVAQPRVETPAPAPAVHAPAAERRVPPRPPGHITAPSVDDGREDDSWVDSDHMPVQDDEPVVLPRRRGRRTLAAIAAAVVVIAAGAWFERDMLTGLFAPSAPQTASAPASAPQEAPAETPATPPAAPAEQPQPKIADRLPMDAPAAPAGGTAPATPAAPAAPAAPETPAAPAAAPAAEAPAPAPAEAPGPATAELIEEGASQGAPGSQFKGAVTWAMSRESIGGGAPEPIVRASVDVAERSMKVTLVFRKNRDSALPASHLIEVAFDLGPKFNGGGIANVPGIIMKETSSARGDALIGASAKVSNGLFWIALSSSPADSQRNLDLLRTREWIDVPILFTNGKRAILTIRKGTTGDKAIDDALAAWSGN
ncbi:hypothetical protein [Pseudoxanthobacter sp.]|uniref:hypothetical protein n=1 Tax=Pseudoxanthobacter sp. TaxID=1925742 RepID=UPI002FE1BC25